MQTQIHAKFAVRNVFPLKVDWRNVKKYCEQRGMQMVTLKTSNEMQQVDEQIKQRGFRG
jgi:hypothetical protein